MRAPADRSRAADGFVAAALGCGNLSDKVHLDLGGGQRRSCIATRLPFFECPSFQALATHSQAAPHRGANLSTRRAAVRPKTLRTAIRTATRHHTDLSRSQ